jgi:5'-3' exoribonuclease 2
MKTMWRLLLIAGLLCGTLTFVTTPSQAGPFRRGGNRGYGWGRSYNGPGSGYRQVYRPYGYGAGGYGNAYGGYGMGYPGYSMGYGGYGIGSPVYGVGGFGMGNSGMYGNSMSFGSPMSGFSMGSYPY